MTERLTKARLEVNAMVNAGRRALYAIDQAIEEAQTPAPAPAADIYERGTSYPTAATVNVGSFEVAPGATEIHVPVKLDRASPNTVIAHVRCYNGTGGRARPDTTKPVFFHPGDRLEQTVTFAVDNMAEGHTVRIVQATVPDGAKRGQNGGTVKAVVGAGNRALPAGRRPITFDPHGALAYDASGAECANSGLWLDRLAHGRTQVGNGETGYYHPDAITTEGDDLILRSYRMDEPKGVGSPAVMYPFAASMLSGLDARGSGWPKGRPELTFRYGTIEWQVQMPNRRNSWPALWLLGVSESGSALWPPEIDVFEGFYYNGSFKAGSDLSHNLHGGPNGTRTWTRAADRHTMKDHGLSPTLDTEFHLFACTVTPEWIILFVDGVETFRYANPFNEACSGWYPLMNVAVKAPMDDPYDQGSGDMTLRRVRIWREQ